MRSSGPLSLGYPARTPPPPPSPPHPFRARIIMGIIIMNSPAPPRPGVASVRAPAHICMMRPSRSELKRYSLGTAAAAARPTERGVRYFMAAPPPPPFLMAKTMLIINTTLYRIAMLCARNEFMYADPYSYYKSEKDTR